MRTYIPGDICPQNVRTTSHEGYMSHEGHCPHYILLRFSAQEYLNFNLGIPVDENSWSDNDYDETAHIERVNEKQMLC